MATTRALDTRLMMKRTIASFALLFLLSGFAQAAEFKIATWNISWLTNKPAGHRDLPRGVSGKSPEDLELLRAYAQQLNADVVAFQEVDGPLMAARVFPQERYAVVLTDESDIQRPGFAIRRGINFRRNPDLIALDLNPTARHSLRRGADITLELPGGRELRLLSIHLKSGCRRDSFENARSNACVTLSRQVPALQEWVRAREHEGVAYAILGDFNRQITPRDDLWRALTDASGSLVRATEGRSNPCWGGSGFIDHLIFGGPAATWLQRDNLRVMTYREQAPEYRERLSDHCPVSARISVPD